jgi:hypothetical protein
MNENILNRKSKRVVVSNSNNKPLLVYHNEKKDHFQKLQDRIPELNNEINEKAKTICNLREMCEKSQSPSSKDFTCCKPCLKNRGLYLDALAEMQKLQTEIYKIQTREEESEYYLTTCEILSEFTDATVSGKMAPGRKQELLNDYLTIIDSSFMGNNTNANGEFDYCANCNGYKIHDPVGGTFVCEKCAISVTDGLLSSRPSFKEAQTLGSSKQFEYKRAGHFKHWLNKTQGKEQAEIPDEIYTGIESEISKERIKDRSKITPTKVRAWLKKISFTTKTGDLIKGSKYYDNIESITRLIGGIKTIDIPPHREEKLINLFKEVEEVFEIVKPDYMSNFMSFPYTIFKLCELLEWDEYLPRFKLLSRDERLARQDKVWEKICKELKWEFYPTSNIKIR